MYVLLCGRVPFDGNDNEEIKEKVIEGEIDFYYYPWPFVSQDAKDLISSMLSVDPA